MSTKNSPSEQQINFGNPPWLSATPTQNVLTALTSSGAEVRLIGGCVRDALANRTVKDIDIATPIKPDDVIILLKRFNIKAIPTGLSHGTITAVC